jgi:spermidine/putrescine ABC transporter ATP-binding subunit
MSKVSLRGVTARYGVVTALHPLDLEIAQGQFVTLLGPSGCGKTTTLRLIAGFLTPDAGHILFDDEEVSRVPPNRRQIGMVFQDYALFPHMTIAENIGFGLRERGVAKAAIDRRVTELLDLIHLPDVGARHPAQLSGGQRQRVALARAVAHPPRVLLMDEPLGALDVKLRETMQAEILRIQRALGITTVFVTHDQSEAMSLSDWIVVMNHGRVEQSGTARALYDHPRSRFVADFFGKISFLPVTMHEVGEDGTVVECLGQTVRLSACAPALSGRVTLGLRPEHLRLLPPDAAQETQNTLPGRVATAQFLGNVLRCEVAVADDLLVLVETIPNDPLGVPGTNVRLAWRHDQGALFADPPPERSTP